jgi:hypothetical protein
MVSAIFDQEGHPGPASFVLGLKEFFDQLLFHKLSVLNTLPLGSLEHPLCESSLMSMDFNNNIYKSRDWRAHCPVCLVVLLRPGASHCLSASSIK